MTLASCVLYRCEGTGAGEVKLDKIPFSTWPLIIPFAHVVVTSAYLLCYSIGFGGNIGAFLSVEDVFSTSLTQVAPIYVTGLAFPAALVMWRHTWKYAYEADRIAAIEDDNRRTSAVRKLRYIRRGILLYTILTLLGATYRIVDNYLRAEPMPVFMLSFLAPFVAIVFLGKLTNSGKLSWKLFEAGVLLIMFTSSALATGVWKGQSDRLSSYEYLSASRPMCGDYAVLRRVSGKALAVGPDERRALLDEECAPTIRFQLSQPKGRLQIGWPPIVLTKAQ